VIAPGFEPPDELLNLIITQKAPCFALIYRPESGAGGIDILIGDVSTPDSLADLSLAQPGACDTGARHDSLVIVPFRQITERGFDCRDDKKPLIAMKVERQGVMGMQDALNVLPERNVEFVNANFDVDDRAYADIVRKVVAEEIGSGAGSNFVIKRSYMAEIVDYSLLRALAFFRRLLEHESGAYWTFIVHTGSRTFIGASPERHVSLDAGLAVMNPISGTYRYPSSGPTLPEVLHFLGDRKEAEELYMVVDEELKMMAGICENGARVVGPFLKEMAKLAHTEYLIEGRSSLDVRDILRKTMFAPTVTGSPLQSACRVIRRYEPHGRGYYGGVIALAGRGPEGDAALDSAILIRTADIDTRGRLSIGVGATLVRDSVADSETAETHAKVSGLLAALGAHKPTRFGRHPDVLHALGQRNETIAQFWLAEGDLTVDSSIGLAGRRVLIVDAEDTFTSMIEHQLRCLGLSVTVRSLAEAASFAGFDLVVMGPGPGDPRAVDDPKIVAMQVLVRKLFEEQVPFIAVCLSHQVLSMQLGLDVVRLTVPNQGMQRDIDLYGRRALVAFYNTFTARSRWDTIECGGTVGQVSLSRDEDTGDVYAVRGEKFHSVQFHPESVLTADGIRVVREMLGNLLPSAHQASYALPT